VERRASGFVDWRRYARRESLEKLIFDSAKREQNAIPS